MIHAACSVLPVTQRDRIPEVAIEDVVQQIADGFRPRRIILFGSYAYGQPGPESDVDLLVIMHHSMSESRQAIQILKAISYRFGLDLLVYTPEHLEQRLSLGDPFVKEIMTRGKVVYESPGA
jgi:predicted nucleotidyltransferase